MSARPPRYDLLPRAVQHAMRLRGMLIPCGPGMRGAAWPDTATVRLSALAPYLEGGLVAAYLTAAWVLGAAPDPGSPVSVAAGAGRPRLPAPHGTKRFELRFEEGEVLTLGDFAVTCAKRTILDLLHREQPFGAPEREACLALLPLSGLSHSSLLVLLKARRRPHVRLARQRFREIFADADAPSPRLETKVSEGVGA